VVVAGPFVFVSGQLPYDPESGQVKGTEIASQTVQVISNVKGLLKSVGASLEDIVSVTAYLNDISDWDLFNETYQSLMPSPFPSRTTVGVRVHGALVELTVVAYVERGKQA